MFGMFSGLSNKKLVFVFLRYNSFKQKLKSISHKCFCVGVKNVNFLASREGGGVQPPLYTYVRRQKVWFFQPFWSEIGDGF